MEKTPRYTQRERNMVLGYAAQYKDVIENKRTDAESNRKKDEVWRQIAKEFNSRVYHQRTSKQLRQLYKNMKLLLKKDLCGEGKGNRSFMDLLNTLSQQESVAQYIAEQMSPTGSYTNNNGRPQKYDDDYDEAKLPSGSYGDAMDTGVIVIKSEDMSDNDQTSHNGDMDDDDDDCLSTKDIPEVCLEEEDDEIFMSDLRQTLQQRSQLNLSNAQNAHHQQQHQQHQHQQQQRSSPQEPEVTIQNVGGIRVGSIGSMANLQLKALQNSLSNNNNGTNSALSITNANSNTNNNNSNSNNNNSNTNSNGMSNLTTSQRQSQQQSAAEQAQQQLLLNGLGLSAVVHQTPPPTSTGSEHAASGLLSALPALQRAALNSSNSTNGLSAAANHLLMTLNSAVSSGAAGCGGGGGGVGGGNSGNVGGAASGISGICGNSNYGHKSNNHRDTHNHSGSSGHNTSGHSRNNDYLMSLAIEERKRKIDLLNAQIDYWKTLTKMLDANGAHNPTPACLCHFPGKVNGLQTQTSNS